MKRGELYRVAKPPSDPKKFRVYVVVSRQDLLDSRFSTAICAPVFTRYQGLATQVPVDLEEGLKHQSCVCCDELVSLPKSVLTHYMGRLSPQKMAELDRALAIALDLPEADDF